MSFSGDRAARTVGALGAVLAAVGLLLGVGQPAAAQSPAAPADRGRAELLVRLDDGLLTVMARDVSQRDLLESLAKELGFELVMAGPLDARRSLELHRKPWDEVLKKALFPASWSFVYDASRGRDRLAKVIVFAPAVVDHAVPSGTLGGPAPTPAVPTVVLAPAAPPAQGQPWSSPGEVKRDLRMLQERLTTAEDAKDQLATLQAIATRGGPADVAEGLAQLSGQPEDARELLKAMESQTTQLPDVQYAIGEMLKAVEEEPRPLGQ